MIICMSWLSSYHLNVTEEKMWFAWMREATERYDKGDVMNTGIYGGSDIRNKWKGNPNEL